MKKRVNQPAVPPAGKIICNTWVPECAKDGSLSTLCFVGSTPSCHAASVPDSKSSVKIVLSAGGGGATTVSDAVPVTPSLVAVMVVVPAETLVTMPLASTRATAVLELDHAIDRPVRMLPLASFNAATA